MNSSVLFQQKEKIQFINAVSVERKKGNTNQLKGEFCGENWGRRLSPLPARRKSLLLRALLQWEGWLAGGGERRRHGRVVYFFHYSVHCTEHRWECILYLRCFLQLNIGLSSSSSQSISLFNGSTCSQVQQLSRPIQLDSSSRSAPRSATCRQSIPLSTATKTSASKTSTHTLPNWIFCLVILQPTFTCFKLNDSFHSDHAVSQFTCQFHNLTFDLKIYLLSVAVLIASANDIAQIVTIISVVCWLSAWKRNCVAFVKAWPKIQSTWEIQFTSLRASNRFPLRFGESSWSSFAYFFLIFLLLFIFLPKHF